MPEPPYRDIHYPLNVFMHILTKEEGRVANLHYGFFEDANETIAAAQEHSTNELLSRLPPAPARLLDAGSGVGTTLAKLVARGYDAQGITPDEKQIAIIRSNYNNVDVQCVRFEDLESSRFDTVIFQESSQYIDSNALFEKAAEMTSHVVVLDEFAMQKPSTLHSHDEFIRAATSAGFSCVEDVDVTAKAAPTIDYFNIRIPKYRQALVDDLGVTNEQIDDLIASGIEYRDRYTRGLFVYRLMQFRR